MRYEDSWEVVRPLGEGGQGKVSLVRKKSSHEALPDDGLRLALCELTGLKGGRERDWRRFRRGILSIVEGGSPENNGALKVLHKPKEARDPERADERIRREIQAMSDMSHPNLLRIRDFDPKGQWFVSEYHPNGALCEKPDLFKGDFHAALKAFRPLVAGVAELHQNGFVHRDVKPANVFLSSKDQLVLGDFGLVYFADDTRTRFSGTFENVGTRDWMAPWAMGQRIDEVRPSIDVFGLGKLLWFMVSGQPFLRLWYFKKDEFNVAKMFPDLPHMNLANRLFARTIVEDEKDCLKGAGSLLREVDQALRIIDLRADVISDEVKRRCKVCGIGTYELVVNRGQTDMRNFGIEAVGNHTMMIFTCEHCGHVQLFSFDGTKDPPAWSKSQ